MGPAGFPRRACAGDGQWCRGGWPAAWRMAVTRSSRFWLSRPGKVSRRGAGVLAAMLAARVRMRCSPRLRGSCPWCRAVSAASPVDPGQQGGPVADAGPGVREAGEVVAVQDAVVADEQSGAGLICVQPGRVGAQRASQRGAHGACSGSGAGFAGWLACWSRMRCRAACLACRCRKPRPCRSRDSPVLVDDAACPSGSSDPEGLATPLIPQQNPSSRHATEFPSGTPAMTSFVPSTAHSASWPDAAPGPGWRVPHLAWSRQR